MERGYAFYIPFFAFSIALMRRILSLIEGKNFSSYWENVFYWGIIIMFGFVYKQGVYA